MDHMLTEREKRFVLAEMIKASTIRVDALANFIRTHQVEPDWMNMQLPHGRNMNQCIQAAEQLSVNASSLKRRSSNDQTEFNSKRLATADRPDYSLQGPHYQHPLYQLPPPAASHAPILPRPSTADHRDAASQPKPEPPRKRGRPSRQDKAKRDLQPLLPRPSVPGPSQMFHASPTSQASDQGTAPPVTGRLAPLAPKRPEVPALLASPVSAARPITPPEAYIPTKGESASPRGRVNSSSPRGDRGGPSAYPARDIDAPRQAPTKRVLVE